MNWTSSSEAVAEEASPPGKGSRTSQACLLTLPSWEDQNLVLGELDGFFGKKKGTSFSSFGVVSRLRKDTGHFYPNQQARPDVWSWQHLFLDTLAPASHTPLATSQQLHPCVSLEPRSVGDPIFSQTVTHLPRQHTLTRPPPPDSAALSLMLLTGGAEAGGT